MAGGCPKKRPKNISGLQQGWQASAAGDSSKIKLRRVQDDDNELETRGQTEVPGLKVDFRQEYDGGTTEESDADMVGEIEQLDDTEFGWRLAEMAAKEDDKGLDWLPEWLHQHRKQTMRHRHESLPFSG
ncbi:hypothetical protein PISMIDRAFT_23740 [Pisolithus microcarpus 441]|uniref:Uncharacterized protein n=1 Tax=Pisolithus microcarpus 441 TaxID=765257 RepID=A0A0C9YBQ0_9AGAM|nr:hypothetical protein BKA83DRAFT_23740 [Pisolithus microcarpus]KIK22185.1 hypothetical protein PISMIDRAFT_23740 [Pisolithus microcarpus 441]